MPWARNSATQLAPTVPQPTTATRRGDSGLPIVSRSSWETWPRGFECSLSIIGCGNLVCLVDKNLRHLCPCFGTLSCLLTRKTCVDDLCLRLFPGTASTTAITPSQKTTNWTDTFFSEQEPLSYIAFKATPPPSLTEFVPLSSGRHSRRHPPVPD
jgi:hypothetical protein